MPSSWTIAGSSPDVQSAATKGQADTRKVGSACRAKTGATWSRRSANRTGQAGKDDTRWVIARDPGVQHLTVEGRREYRKRLVQRARCFRPLGVGIDVQGDIALHQAARTEIRIDRQGAEALAQECERAYRESSQMVRVRVEPSFKPIGPLSPAAAHRRSASARKRGRGRGTPQRAVLARAPTQMGTWVEAYPEGPVALPGRLPDLNTGLPRFPAKHRNSWKRLAKAD